MLLTFNVPFAPEAVRFAIDAACDAGSELMVCDGIPLDMNPAARGPRSFGDPEALDSASAAVPRRGRRRPAGASSSCSTARGWSARRSRSPATTGSGCWCSGPTRPGSAGGGTAARPGGSAGTRRAWSGRSSALAEIERDLLGLGQGVDDPAGQLAARPGLLRPAERRQLIPVVRGLVDVDGAVLQRLGRPPCVVQRAGEDRRGQAVLGLVGDRQRLVQRLEAS